MIDLMGARKQKKAYQQFFKELLTPSIPDKPYTYLNHTLTVLQFSVFMNNIPMKPSLITIQEFFM